MSKPKLKPINYQFEAIGTQWSIDLFNITNDIAEPAYQQILELIDDFDKTYSRFRKDSLITKMSLKAGDYPMPADALPMLNFYTELYELTDGKVTPLIGQVMSDAGYDAQYSFTKKAMTLPPKWDKIVKFNDQTLTIIKPALLDFGAAGKGYLVDLIGQYLVRQGINSFCIDGSGDMLARKLTKPLRVGLENPANTSQVVGVIELSNQALCGSAGNRRSWGNFHHIIDPDKLASPQKIAAVWVVCQSTMIADGLTTALFFIDINKIKTKLQSKYTFEYAIVMSDGSLQVSDNFPAKFFTNFTIKPEESV